MKTYILSFFTCLSFLPLFSQSVSIQGVLRDPAGRAVDDGSYSVTFQIYEVAIGGTAIWTETHPNLITKHGVFNAPLGSIEPFGEVPFDDSTFIGVTIDGYAEMSPRIKLATFPSAMSVNGSQNTFPSDGNVTIGNDHLVLEGGSIRLLTGEIIFPDDTRLNSAEAGSANTVTSRTDARIIADDDTTGSGEIQFIIADRNEMVMNHQGELGVGTLSPENRLHVKSAGLDIATFESTHVNGTNLRLRNSAQTFQWDIRSDNNGFHITNATNSVSPLTVGILNNIGIGNLTPDYQLSIGEYLGVEAGDGSTIAGHIRLGDPLGSLSGLSLNFTNGTGTELMSLTDNGNLSLSGMLNAGEIMVSNISSTASEINVSPNIRMNQTLSIGNLDLKMETGSISGGGFMNASTHTDALAFRTSSGNLLLGITDQARLVFPTFNISSAIGTPVTGSLNYGDGTGWRFRFYNPEDEWTLMTVTDQGRVGIGIDNPIASLHVKDLIQGTGMYSADADILQWNNVHSFDNQTFHPAIFAEGIVCASLGFIGASNPQYSDRRFKKIIGVSQGKEDLLRLRQIEITDYQYIDQLVGGGKMHKKVVAQQVKEVYPEAVGYISKAIPSIYQTARKVDFKDKELMIETEAEHGLQEGDYVDLMTESETRYKQEVLSTPDPHTFIVSSSQKPQAVFVYGKWVDDFHTVDYDALSMLHISASQELARRIEALETENAALRARVERLEALEAKVSELLEATTDRALLNR